MPTPRSTSPFTYNLTNATMSFSENDGFTAISFVLISGSGSYLGDVQKDTTPSQGINLVLNQPVTIAHPLGYTIIDFSITAGAGSTIQIVAMR